MGSGIIEFMAIGTAVKKMPGVSTHSPMLIPQAIIQDKDYFCEYRRSYIKDAIKSNGKIIVICHLSRVRDSPLAPSFLKYLP
ncbi:hypothetical protein BV375_21915 [Nostoc sp. 106C]|nr:hypothetical protein BV375_21915 [Nostoc sp. 106C]